MNQVFWAVLRRLHQLPPVLGGVVSSDWGDWPNSRLSEAGARSAGVPARAARVREEVTRGEGAASDGRAAPAAPGTGGGSAQTNPGPATNNIRTTRERGAANRRTVVITASSTPAEPAAAPPGQAIVCQLLYPHALGKANPERPWRGRRVHEQEDAGSNDPQTYPSMACTHRAHERLRPMD